MRLLLTSNGLTTPQIQQEFLGLLGKAPAEARVFFDVTASQAEDDTSYLEAKHTELTSLGILKENIVESVLGKQVMVENLSKFDVILVNGGNTFYLLQKVRESGFERAVKEYLQKDMGVYVGISAGTILAGPDIEVSEPWDDKSRATLAGTKGLGLVTTTYIPHFQKKDAAIVERLRQKANYPLSTINDSEAVVSDGKVDRLIT